MNCGRVDVVTRLRAVDVIQRMDEVVRAQLARAGRRGSPVPRSWPYSSRSHLRRISGRGNRIVPAALNDLLSCGCHRVGDSGVQLSDLNVRLCRRGLYLSKCDEVFAGLQLEASGRGSRQCRTVCAPYSASLGTSTEPRASSSRRMGCHRWNVVCKREFKLLLPTLVRSPTSRTGKVTRSRRSRSARRLEP